jgi:hypothetical protein
VSLRPSPGAASARGGLAPGYYCPRPSASSTGESPALYEVNNLPYAPEVRLGYVRPGQEAAKRHPFTGPKARNRSSRGPVRQGRTQPPVPKHPSRSGPGAEPASGCIFRLVRMRRHRQGLPAEWDAERIALHAQIRDQKERVGGLEAAITHGHLRSQTSSLPVHRRSCLQGPFLVSLKMKGVAGRGFSPGFRDVSSITSNGRGGREASR